LPIAGGSLLLGYLTLQRLAEVAIDRRHTPKLLARGAYEVGAKQYPVLVAFHTTWLLTLWGFGWNHTLRPGFVALFVLLQIGRLWVMRTLGERWTTRVIMTPWAAPVTSGLYRFLRHPNYLIVALELPCVSLALGLLWHAIVFGALNLVVTGRRARSEDEAFAELAASQKADQN
jgi:methyltransferase